jgi:hypothetical protein
MMPGTNGERTLHEWMRHLDVKLDAQRNALDRRLTAISAKLDKKADAAACVREDVRIRKLESFASRAKGVIALLSLVGGVAASIFLMGCAHYHHRTYVDGELSSDTVSTVLGTGDTSFIGPDEEYTTSDTGISDNGKEAIVEAVEAGIRAALPLP